MRPTVAFLALLLAASLRATPAPVSLITAKDLAGWEFIAQPKTDLASVTHFTADGAFALAGKPIGYIATKPSFDNYRLHAEWRWPVDAAKHSNGGILIHIATGPKDRAWPECFQVQLKPGRAGDLLPMAGATFAEKLSTPPDAKTPQLNHQADGIEKPLGEWNGCDIVVRDGVVDVTINGHSANHISDAVPGAGKVGFQFEGTPYQLRNVTITPLD